MLQNVRSKLASLSLPSSSTAVRNYLTLRKLIGVLGISLPVVMWLGERLFCSAQLQPTISDYYYTHMRDEFVGILWAIGVFLVCYRGTRVWDDVISTAAGVCAILVALFPTKPHESAADRCVIPSVISPTWRGIIGNLHYIFAALFFLSITAMALFLFRNRGKHDWTNGFYKVCGGAMLACVLWMVFGVTFLKETIAVGGLRMGVACEWNWKAQRSAGSPLGGWTRAPKQVCLTVE
jgi:hypothetical protein